VLYLPRYHISREGPSIQHQTLRRAILVPLLLLLSSASLTQDPPLREVRAVWLATAAGLDWPTTTDRVQQQSSLRAILEQLSQAQFNTVFFQVRPRGDAYYQSHHEPWAENLSGTMGKDPGWDPLRFLIDEAHRRGIEVHAWVNVFKVRSNNDWPPSVMHPMRKFPQWCFHYQGEDWMDPGYPGVRTYTVNVILDLVRNYDLDGVNLDYARYPGADFPDDASYRQYGYRMARERWRVHNISSFVAAVYDSVTSLKPWVKIGSSPLGIPGTELDPSTASTLRRFSQDAPSWIEARKQDYVSPQLYWTIGGNHGTPDFSALIERWARWSEQRQVYAGIAAYKPEVMRELQSEIDVARSAGASGEAYFRFGSLFPQAAQERLYKAPALIPPMPWKDAMPPMPVSSAAASELWPGRFQLEWIAPPAAADGDRAHAYVIRRSTAPAIDPNNPAAIVAVVPAHETLWADTIVTPSCTTLYYTVTALDRGNNESEPSPAAAATLREAVALRIALRPEESPALEVDTLTSGELFAAYRLPARAEVLLELVRKHDDGTSEVLASRVRDTQNAGAYLLRLQWREAVEGSVTVRLKAGGHTVERDAHFNGR